VPDPLKYFKIRQCDTNRRWIRWLPGGICVVLAAVANESFLKWLLAYPGYEVELEQRLAIACLQIFTLSAGFALLTYRDAVARWFASAVESRTGKRALILCRALTPPIDRLTFVVILPVIVLGCGWMLLVIAREGYSPAHPLVWLHFLDKLAFDSALYMTGIAVGIRVLRLRVAALLWAAFFLSVSAVDIVVYYFSRTRFEWQLIDFIAPYSIRGFLTPERQMLLLLVCVILIVATMPIALLKRRLSNSQAQKWVALTVFLGVVQPSTSIPFVLSPLIPSDLQRTLFQQINHQLDYADGNSVVNLAREALPRQSVDVPEIATNDYRRVTAHFELPMGRREYPPLALKAFRRIVLITTESLSLDLLWPHNGQIVKGQSPFYSSDSVQRQIFVNYHTSATPTLPGLNVLMTSHPNPQLAIASDYRQSFVRDLADEGFRTIFLRSASRFFADENIHFRKAGFQEIVAREFFEKDPRNRTYIAEWGACDRLVFDELVNRLIAHRNDRVFVTVLPVDTHLPSGRTDYRGLDYPSIPESIRCQTGDLAGLMRAVFYHDHDISRLIKRLKSEDLWDDETLIILTADHSAPMSDAIESLTEAPAHPLGRIPIVFLTPQSLPEADRNVLASQVDLAPTLFHLLGLKVPPGYWGESLFFRAKSNPAVDVFRECVELTGRAGMRRIKISSPENRHEKDLVKLYNSLLFENRPPPARARLIAHAGGYVDGRGGHNTRQALDNSYANGFRFFELDFQWTSDDHLVAIHDWQYSYHARFNLKDSAAVPTRARFESLRHAHGWVQLTLDSIAEWFADHPDAFLITDIKSDNLRGLEHLRNQHPALAAQTIPQIYAFDEYADALRLGYEEIILTLYRKRMRDDRIQAFVQRRPVFAVTMPTVRALNSDSALRLKKLGVFVYAHTVNDREMQQRLLNRGVGGVYTDLLMPVGWVQRQRNPPSHGVFTAEGRKSRIGSVSR
jgi:glycerophosphoryl diester phosphodiesterase